MHSKKKSTYKINKKKTKCNSVCETQDGSSKTVSLCTEALIASGAKRLSNKETCSNFQTCMQLEKKKRNCKANQIFDFSYTNSKLYYGYCKDVDSGGGGSNR